MWCSDPALNLLETHGYCTILLPKADIKPLQILSNQGKHLERLGLLTTLFQTSDSVALPPVKENVPAAHISGQCTGTLKTGMGISLLDRILGAMGASGFSQRATYRHAHTLTFEFRDVLEDSIEIAELDKYLNGADVDPSSRHLATLLEADRIYIITAAIKSRQFSVTAKKADNSDLELHVPEIQNAVGGNIYCQR
jgi:hypothetical protein